MNVSPARDAAPTPFLRLRFSSMLALAFLGLAAIALAYVGGVMAGRASASAERQTAAQSAHSSKGPSSAAQGQATARASGEPEVSAILSPEELRFARALRRPDGAPENSGPQNKAANPVVIPKESAQASQLPVLIPGQTGSQIQGQNGTAQAGASIMASGGSTQSKPELAPQASPIQDYIFQMGAFKDEESVDSLRQRLEGRGLRTRMQKDGKLFVVLVLLRGDNARAEEVLQIAEELRLGKPIIRSRKPVQQP